jgi:hypothetical protein
VAINVGKQIEIDKKTVGKEFLRVVKAIHEGRNADVVLQMLLVNTSFKEQLIDLRVVNEAYKFLRRERFNYHAESSYYVVLMMMERQLYKDHWKNVIRSVIIDLHFVTPEQQIALWMTWPEFASQRGYGNWDFISTLQHFKIEPNMPAVEIDALNQQVLIHSYFGERWDRIYQIPWFDQVNRYMERIWETVPGNTENLPALIRLAFIASQAMSWFSMSVRQEHALFERLATIEKQHSDYEMAVTRLMLASIKHDIKRY